eukprot:TRINITY_DN964_c1_g1_i4.p1 TRINITY_DN964_c1_g1~~TRINITY_DN964_c1_g1_i4.p1  ORF type:complete len:521 (-),score=-43.11 TRINITY_DN964_c1_g1_i4:1478-2812(-)
MPQIQKYQNKFQLCILCLIRQDVDIYQIDTKYILIVININQCDLKNLFQIYVIIITGIIFFAKKSNECFFQFLYVLLNLSQSVQTNNVSISCPALYNKFLYKLSQNPLNLFFSLSFLLIFLGKLLQCTITFYLHWHILYIELGRYVPYYSVQKYIVYNYSKIVLLKNQVRFNSCFVRIIFLKLFCIQYNVIYMLVCIYLFYMQYIWLLSQQQLPYYNKLCNMYRQLLYTCMLMTIVCQCMHVYIYIYTINIAIIVVLNNFVQLLVYSNYTVCIVIYLQRGMCAQKDQNFTLLPCLTSLRKSAPSAIWRHQQKRPSKESCVSARPWRQLSHLKKLIHSQGRSRYMASTFSLEKINPFLGLIKVVASAKSARLGCRQSCADHNGVRGCLVQRWCKLFTFTPFWCSFPSQQRQRQFGTTLASTFQVDGILVQLIVIFIWKIGFCMSV